MYADRFSPSARFNPATLTLAIGLNAAMVAALLLSSPNLVFTPADPPLTTYNVPPPVPKPEPAKPVERHTEQPRERIDAPLPPIPLPLPDQPDVALDTTPVAPAGGAGTGFGTGPVVLDPPLPPAPVIVQPEVDGRYAGDLQPPYPAEERRAGHEGRVVIRVLIGTDGRVKQAERVSAASDAFWRTTLDRAMRKWRFKPATRNGIPFEAWRTMSLTFRLEG